ncbi:hypothetical protein JG687_00012310 [Phytophthora cactorum]|uniref:Uncharacterized protein n=1 Tax=Phytophthora cactorum TaxID=29920 RepID=A0A8T1U240_9STRA|nr:hypothetical protein JG687_00012310 [Phytophthora cactorum]
MHTSEIVTLAVALRGHSGDLQQLRRQVHQLLVDAELKHELKVRHRLTAACLGMQHLSAWSLLNKYGTDENLLNVSTLTRDAFNKLLAWFAEFFFFRSPNLDAWVGDHRS